MHDALTSKQPLVHIRFPRRQFSFMHFFVFFSFILTQEEQDRPNNRSDLNKFWFSFSSLEKEKEMPTEERNLVCFLTEYFFTLFFCVQSLGIRIQNAFPLNRISIFDK